MSAELVRMLLEELDDQGLAELAERLQPFLASSPAATTRLTVEQAAQRTGLSPRTVRRALSAGLLEGERAAGRWRVPLDALELWRAAGAPARPGATRQAPPPRRSPRRSSTATSAADAILGRHVA